MWEIHVPAQYIARADPYWKPIIQTGRPTSKVIVLISVSLDHENLAKKERPWSGKKLWTGMVDNFFRMFFCQVAVRRYQTYCGISLFLPPVPFIVTSSTPHFVCTIALIRNFLTWIIVVNRVHYTPTLIRKTFSSATRPATKCARIAGKYQTRDAYVRNCAERKVVTMDEIALSFITIDVAENFDDKDVNIEVERVDKWAV